MSNAARRDAPPGSYARNHGSRGLAATQAGVILGTAAYMAPEQAKGHVADKRCDIWSFGCVLYEMLTGARAFDGDDVSDIMGAGFEVYVRPFPNVGDGQWQVSTAGGTRPLWARNGQELFYVAPDGTLRGVRVDTRGATWRAGTPGKILEGRYFTGGGTGNFSRHYDVSADGQRFLMIKESARDEGAAPPQIVIVKHWFEELKRMAPGN